MTATVPTRLIILSAVVAGLIFAFDLLLPLGVAGGLPYVTLVLLGNWFPRISHLYVMAVVGTVLTILGFFLSPPGGIFWVVISNRALALFGIWITAFLIANRKRAEKELKEKDSELRRVSRLSDMGQITSALAHEINQPLTAIASYIQAARRILEKGSDDTRDKVFENLDKAVAQGTRAAEIIRRLRKFIEKREAEYSKGDINAIVEEARAMALIDAARKGVRVRMNLGRNLPLVVMDKIQIQQVVVNLVRNSLDALVESERRELTVTTLAAEGNSVEVAVSDTGPGLPDEVTKQLFKPFVTTKPDGMGVGLSICRSIIDEHGGRLWMTPNPGGGAIFCFTLPAISDTDKSMISEAIVFVVDDDAAVRDSLKALLESDGLTAEVYGAGQEFLDAHDTDRGGCLLLDVQMPDMNGLELQQKLTDNGSSLPVIIITGHGDVPIAVKALKAGAFDFIEKPFTDDVILGGVRRALELGERSRREQSSVDEAKAGIARLTTREYEVFEHLVIGRRNKQIAFDLGISARTVEIHRARVMKKMGVRNLAHLVRMALALGIEPELP